MKELSNQEYTKLKIKYRAEASKILMQLVEGIAYIH